MLLLRGNHGHVLKQMSHILVTQSQGWLWILDFVCLAQSPIPCEPIHVIHLFFKCSSQWDILHIICFIVGIWSWIHTQRCVSIYMCVHIFNQATHIWQSSCLRHFYIRVNQIWALCSRNSTGLGRSGGEGEGARVIRMPLLLEQLWSPSNQLPWLPHLDINGFIGLGPFKSIVYGNGRFLLSPKSHIY